MKRATRAILLLACGLLALQLFLLGRIALSAVANPQSTTFQRSQAWQLLRGGQPHWAQQWRPYDQISDHLKRAVIASEDSGFARHAGVEWQALRRAWQRNRRADRSLHGGSTITQQLAKNLLLSGQRSWTRKAQELLLAWELELLLSKRRILEIYLNSVEWGSGVFGAEAAAQHYYGKSAAQLSAWESARLAVMLPNPRSFEQQPGSAYLRRRTQTIVARMRSVGELP